MKKPKRVYMKKRKPESELEEDDNSDIEVFEPKKDDQGDSGFRVKPEPESI